MMIVPALALAWASSATPIEHRAQTDRNTPPTAVVMAEMADFRVFPYLVQPSSDGVRITWFSHRPTPGRLTVTAEGFRREYRTVPTLRPELDYSDLEESERKDFPDMHPGPNWKHTVWVRELPADTSVAYTVVQGGSTFQSEFRTAPPRRLNRLLRVIAFADSETDPEGRTTFRRWVPGAQHPESTGRPADIPNYLLTETAGFRENLRIIGSRRPDLLLIAGDIVQGGGYQRAWDEFFFHTAGPWDTILSRIPLVPAIGNWECFGARNGGYEPAAVYASRQKYRTYFDAASNGWAQYQNVFHRVDWGPLTILTLDSSNGLPDNTDADTNRNIDSNAYPGTDLPDISPGSRQWRWTEAQLADARTKGQIVFVQFHHIPYSSGGHSLPLTAEGSSGQAGLPMRAYHPMFLRYGVTAVLCGHNESFEISEVDGLLYVDAGVAGDGLGIPVDDVDPRRANPWRRWVAHRDEAELWAGRRLVSGGKHYGHLEIDLTPTPDGRIEVTFTPVHAFPVTNDDGRVVAVERRAVDRVFRYVRPMPNP
ncbi:MAG: metallophosphoesterase [Fimbriimonadaceae bacterium]